MAVDAAVAFGKGVRVVGLRSSLFVDNIVPDSCHSVVSLLAVDIVTLLLVVSSCAFLVALGNFVLHAVLAASIRIFYIV